MLLRRWHRVACRTQLRRVPTLEGTAARSTQLTPGAVVGSSCPSPHSFICTGAAHAALRFASTSQVPPDTTHSPHVAARAGDIDTLKEVVRVSGIAALQVSEPVPNDARARFTLVQTAILGGSVDMLEFLLEQLGQAAFTAEAGARTTPDIVDTPSVVMLRVGLLSTGAPRRVLDFLLTKVLNGQAPPTLGKQLAVYAAVQDAVSGYEAVTSLFGDDATVDGIELISEAEPWLSAAHVAARHGSVGVLEHLHQRFGPKLLETGSHQQAADPNQPTPAALAAMAGQVASLEVIESRIGADVMGAQRFRGMPLVQVAVASGRAETAAFLEGRPGGEVAMGATVPPDNMGVAHVAVASSDAPLEMLAFVAGLPYGQRLLHARCVHGGTIAHYAALANCPLAVFEAIERHAGRKIFAVKNLHDETALDLVEEDASADVVAFLTAACRG